MIQEVCIILQLTLSYDIVEVWELRKARLYGENNGVPCLSLKIHLGNWGMFGTVRCLHFKVDTTTILCVCICTVGSA